MLASATVVVQRLSRILIQLNIATRVHHVAADAPWLDLMVPTVSKHRYVTQLLKVYGFEAPLEAAFRYTAGLSSLVDLRARARTGLLVQDLMRLGFSASRIAELPQRFMTFSSAAEALGWLYVGERATLLHGGVRRYLSLRVPEAVSASSYLSAYDGIVGARWSELGAALDTVAQAPAVMHQIVRAANQAFSAAASWFRDGDVLRSVGT